jgi:AmmeMemoRadiSam system protein B
MFNAAGTGFASEIKEPDFAGSFYPAEPSSLSRMIEGFLLAADPAPLEADIFALIVPHAGYEFSGRTAAYAYKLIRERSYKTVVIIASSHRHGFEGVCVFSGLPLAG